jgi:NADH:ubiquinone oxidoreductase subunit 3 (subunit A)
MSYGEFVGCAAFFAQLGLLAVLAFGLLAASRLSRARHGLAGPPEEGPDGEDAVGAGLSDVNLRFYGAATAFLLFAAVCALVMPVAAVLREASAMRDPASGWLTPALTAFLELGCFFAVLLPAAAYVVRKGHLGWIGPLRDPDAGSE